MTRSYLRNLLLLSVGAACLALASGTALSGASAGTTRHTGANLKYVNKQLRKFSKKPKFVLKAKAINTSKVRGKTIFNIPFSSSIPFVVGIDNSMKKLAKHFGMKFVEYVNQGQPSQWSAGIDQAISQRASVIELNGAPNPALLQPQLAKAHAAGIPVTATHWNDVHVHKPSNITALIDPPYNKAGRLMADWAIKDTKGKADVLVLTSADIVPSDGIVRAIKNEFSRYCGSGCKVSVINEPGNAWPNFKGAVESALLKDPNINYILPLYDSMSEFAIPAISAAGRTGKVHIATYNGTPFVMKDLEQGNVVRMEVGENLNWLAYATIDQIMRVLTGMKPVKNEHTTLRVFTSANIKQAGTPPTIAGGYGRAYVKGYHELWKKK